MYGSGHLGQTKKKIKLMKGSLYVGNETGTSDKDSISFDNWPRCPDVVQKVSED